ncbi:MAG: thioesterase family protein [Pirellulales bacterium]
MNRKIPPLDLEGLPVTYRQEIPENYRDEMGHMNVMWYTYLFSSAFDKFADAWGFNEVYCLANQAGSFALETHVRYLNEVHIGKHVTVRSRALGRSAKRFHFMHFMTIDETGALAAIQEHVAGHIDMRVRRMAPFPPDLAERYDQLVARQNALGWEAPVCGVMRP